MALKHFAAAVDILTLQLKGKDRAVADINSTTKNDDEDTRRTIVRALIGQVEIWMDPTHELW
jgi:hypothetical protein